MNSADVLLLLSIALAEVKKVNLHFTQMFEDAKKVSVLKTDDVT